jgi:hypothetical protein
MTVIATVKPTDAKEMTAEAERALADIARG